MFQEYDIGVVAESGGRFLSRIERGGNPVVSGLETAASQSSGSKRIWRESPQRAYSERRHHISDGRNLL